MTGDSEGGGPSTRPRVLVGHASQVCRDGLAAAIRLRPDLNLIGEASDGDDALACLGDMRPDLALLHLKLWGLDAPELLAGLARDQIGTRVVLLSDLADSEVADRAIAAGAFGCISADAARDEICDALIAVARGRVVVPPSWRRRSPRGGASLELPLLTGREHEIFALMADGLSGPQIAKSLYVSPNTVKTHLRHLYKKLGVSDRAAAVAKGIRQGILR